MVDRITDLLRFDPLQCAEDITGKSSHDDEATQWLGLGLADMHGRAKDRAIVDAGDTPFSCKIEVYDRIVKDTGFELVLTLPFRGRYDRNEEFRVYARRDGLLLTTDTFGGDERNSATVFYNWRPRQGWFDDPDREYVTSTGGYKMPGDPMPQRALTPDEHAKMVWVGNHDAREALRHKLTRLEKHGSFVTPWITRKSVYLTHYGDEKGADWRRLTAERIAMLPAWVREMITPL